ncbi:MAG: hypothetical protein KKB12_02275, partial [Candidatus Omnitrophica bacterium]|nr:hypothetical protein [Candidatus Omnitrophota bacterium]
MMVRTIAFYFILAACLCSLTGCASLKKVFSSKKDEPAKPKTYQSLKKYDVHPSIELYTKRYIYWKTWHKELLAVLAHSNNKKTMVAVEQDIANLTDMQQMLTDEKSAEMQPLVDEMLDIERVIKKERVTGGNAVRLRIRIETVGRAVKKDFSYRKIEGYIADDFRR